MTITRQTVIGDILDTDNSVAPLFLAIGMHCLGCPASRGETIEQACAVHGTDAEAGGEAERPLWQRLRRPGWTRALPPRPSW